jgi:hypothetical protein
LISGLCCGNFRQNDEPGGGFQPAAIINRMADLLEARAAGIVIAARHIERDAVAAEAAASMLA